MQQGTHLSHRLINYSALDALAANSSSCIVMLCLRQITHQPSSSAARNNIRGGIHLFSYAFPRSSTLSHGVYGLRTDWHRGIVSEGFERMLHNSFGPWIVRRCGKMIDGVSSADEIPYPDEGIWMREEASQRKRRYADDRLSECLVPKAHVTAPLHVLSLWLLHWPLLQI